MLLKLQVFSLTFPIVPMYLVDKSPEGFRNQILL